MFGKVGLDANAVVDVNQEPTGGFLRFEWQKPILLTQHKKLIVGEDDFAQIEEVPGVYYFARNFGEKSVPFYIGQAAKLRLRLTQHLETFKIKAIYARHESGGSAEH